jgi:hypothetical protein
MALSPDRPWLSWCFSPPKRQRSQAQASAAEGLPARPAGVVTGVPRSNLDPPAGHLDEARSEAAPA